jgi:HAD superfamily hydrolase (TIGR01509 family)
MPLHHQAWLMAFAEHGARFDFDWELFTSRAGMGLEETVYQLNNQFGEQLDPGRVVASQRRNYERLVPSLRVIPEVVNVARQFAQSHPMSVASGGDKPVIVAALRALELHELFAHVICQSDVERGKPHPDMFLLCAELMGVSPAQCVVFEDGELGIEAAKAAGMAWVAVDGTGRAGAATPGHRLG